MYQQTITNDPRPITSITISDDSLTESCEKSQKTLGSRSRLSLDQSQRYRLWKFIEESAEQHRRTAHEKLARVATKQLGFEVSKFSIVDARKGTGVDYTVRPGASPKTLRNDRLRFVARALVDLCKQLRVSLPEQTMADLQAIAKAQPMKKTAGEV